MSSNPPGHLNQNQYGSAFSTQPPTASYGQPVHTQPAVNLQMDPTMAAMIQQQMAHASALMDPNNPINSRDPVRIKCPSCNMDVTTETESVAGCFTYMLCSFFCATGILIPLCWIPFLMNRTKNVIHKCPSCKKECGIFNTISRPDINQINFRLNQVDAYHAHGRR